MGELALGGGGVVAFDLEGLGWRVAAFGASRMGGERTFGHSIDDPSLATLALVSIGCSFRACASQAPSEQGTSSPTRAMTPTLCDALPLRHSHRNSNRYWLWLNPKPLAAEG